MALLENIAAELAGGSPNRPLLPQVRQIEFHGRRQGLSFAPAPEALPLAHLAGAVRAFLLLDAFLKARNGAGEATESWQFYLDLPRATGTQKIVAQIYRALRVPRIVLLHPRGGVELRDGVIRIKGFHGSTALALEISAAGLELLDSAVCYLLQSAAGPYPDAYVEAMLAEYFIDIVAEIRRYSDEGRALFQFRRAAPFCRHFRLACDSPKVRRLDTEYEFEVPALYADAARYPIDYFTHIGDRLHIVPAEALAGNRITAPNLEKWRASTEDGSTLPHHFRMRFCRETGETNQPMS